MGTKETEGSTVAEGAVDTEGEAVGCEQTCEADIMSVINANTLDAMCTCLR